MNQQKMSSRMQAAAKVLSAKAEKNKKRKKLMNGIGTALTLAAVVGVPAFLMGSCSKEKSETTGDYGRVRLIKVDKMSYHGAGNSTSYQRVKTVQTPHGVSRTEVTHDCVGECDVCDRPAQKSRWRRTRGSEIRHWCTGGDCIPCGNAVRNYKNRGYDF